MNKFTEIAKGGWHPEKNSKPSYSQEPGLKDKAKGWVGMGNKDPYAEQRNHQSRPLSSLRDPASFAPPPKHQGYYGGQANSPSGAAGLITAPTPANSGQAQVSHQRQIAAREEEEDRPPPGPYRVNTTGLSTAHLPKPPVRRPGQETPETASPARTTPAPPPAPSQKPKLPPRLPPRQNSHPDIHAPLPPPTYQESVQSTPAQPSQGILNQGAINRLGHAGVNVSGFGIGRTASPPVPPRNGSPATPPVPARTASPAQQNQLGGLQSRFAKLSTGSSQPAAPEGGTTFAQKQAAFNTARSFHKDPTSVSVSDLRSAASTANNFRERHGEQVAAGWQKANGLNQKYGVMDRVNGMASGSAGASSASAMLGPVGKKPPPPPPPKKKGSADNSASPPPPVPLASKPRPS
ncbi:Gmp synthase [Lasiodiplodia theobromae]|uniref:Uncharacterized protein n=1 Tax=Lasiodiplodia theobromae TaxID=45133 RepID=A0A5N5DL55_9PEZI|nr:Gmp synthase [Lasiodiplodia theobromae]KAB2577584.1 hypothetical protein DBV05_g3776 [Lasiodiplodia theobromae]KAF4535564.1 Gmp synthase [Lasiodiplodia theobromae]